MGGCGETDLMGLRLLLVLVELHNVENLGDSWGVRGGFFVAEAHLEVHGRGWDGWGGVVGAIVG